MQRCNPFKITTKQTMEVFAGKPVLYLYLYVCTKETGIILNDNECNFKESIRTPTGEQISIDGLQDSYLAIGMRDRVNYNVVTQKLNPAKLLPSTLFIDCKEGDYIAFTFNGQNIVAKLRQSAQHMRRNQKLFYEPGFFPFEVAVNNIISSNVKRQQLFHEDNYIYTINPRTKKTSFQLKTTLPYFTFKGVAMLVHGQIYRGKLGSDVVREISREEFSTIPQGKLNSTPHLRCFEDIQEDGTHHLQFNTIYNSNVTEVEFVYCDHFVYLFSKQIKQSNTDDVYDVIFLDIPALVAKLKKGVKIVSSDNGVLTVELEKEQCQNNSNIYQVDEHPGNRVIFIP